MTIKKANEKGSGKNESQKKLAKVADIKTGSKTLAVGANYEDGMPATMGLHINEGKRGNKRSGGAD